MLVSSMAVEALRKGLQIAYLSALSPIRPFLPYISKGSDQILEAEASATIESCF
jgi:hypothetical protein